MFQPQPPKKKPQTYAKANIIESLRDLGGGVGKTVARDVVGKVGTDALTSLFGALPKKGEMHANEAIRIPSTPEMQPATPRVHQPDVLRPQAIQAEQAKVREQIQAVRMELKALASAVKNFNTQVEKAIDDIPVDPGVYHLNFFDRLRSVLRLLREQMQDSNTWLALSTNRKQKKKYWGLYKKHGTKFGLSSERTLATQAG